MYLSGSKVCKITVIGEKELGNQGFKQSNKIEGNGVEYLKGEF